MTRNIDWKLVRPEHVVAACEHLRAAQKATTARQTGLCLMFGDEKLPAKRTLRLAYCLAAGLPLETKLKFASGDSTLNLLRKLGFAAERLKEAEPS